MTTDRDAAAAAYAKEGWLMRDPEEAEIAEIDFRAGWDAAMEREPQPLEWETVPREYVETYQAKCPFGLYRVFEDEDSAAGAIWIEFAAHEDRFCMTDAVEVDRIYGEFDEAKAVAQADYKRRLSAAFQPPASTGEGADNG